MFHVVSVCNLFSYLKLYFSIYKYCIFRVFVFQIQVQKLLKNVKVTIPFFYSIESQASVDRMVALLIKMSK